jgi:hypothetical protein
MFVPVLVNNPIIVKYNELVDDILNNETVQQFLYTLATVLGVIVGVTVWVKNRVQQWYNNGGKVWMLTVSKRVLYSVSNATESLYYIVADVCLNEVNPVPDVEVAQSKTRRRR